MDLYIQCLLVKDLTSQVSYIPKEFAKQNKTIKLKTGDDWDEGWLVKEVYHNSETTEPPDWRKLIRGHRKSTGDSLPCN